ncbi:hypothetical protein I3760_16G096200 [Carya illinoinensis]|nr:hypothetical protein I3760_16G096200 [Carya illinoinensis]
MATNHPEYIFFYGGKDKEWVKRLASKVNKVADASKQIAGTIDVSHHNDPKTAESKLRQYVQNITPADVEILNDFIPEHSKGWLVLTKNGSVFEKGYGESLQKTMDAFEKGWKKAVGNSGDFGNSFKEALRLSA